MVEWLRHMLHLDAQEAIDLGPGEEILHVIGRHWVVLLAREVPPVMAVLFFGGLAVYRAFGGTFLVVENGAAVGFDLFNIFLAIVVGLLVLLWFALYVRGKKASRARNILVGVGATVLLLIWYRSNGGRVFYIDPVLYSGQQTDPFNTALILLGVVSSIFVLFTFYDWLNDELILTNQRVVYDNDQVFIPRLLEQRVQEQIFLEDVQDVSFKTATYPQELFQFGTITVKSARIGGNITFDAAAGAKEMQRQVVNQMKALQKQMGTAAFDTLIEERVYGSRPPKAPLRATIKQTQSMQALRLILPENPEFDSDSGKYTWRAHWLFLLRALIGPLLLLVLGLASMAILASVSAFDPLLVTIVASLILLIFTAWAAWQVEDYRNDLYILNPTNVVDVDKKPFGPEDRRQAGLGAITNVSFSTTFISNLLNYGDVVLETAGAGGKFTFNHVPRPNEVVTVINDYIVQFKRGEKAKTLNDTVELLARYHEAQRRHNELQLPPP